MKHARADYARFQDPAGLIPEDEPVFLLRGQDVAAPATLRFWADHAIRLGADMGIAILAHTQANYMEQWQRTRTSKIPDVVEPEAAEAREATKAAELQASADAMAVAPEGADERRRVTNALRLVIGHVRHGLPAEAARVADAWDVLESLLPSLAAAAAARTTAGPPPEAADGAR